MYRIPSIRPHGIQAKPALPPAWLRAAIASMAAALLVACGSTGGGDSPQPPPQPVTKYTVGGTVSGLNGSLTLQNNGSDSLVVSTNSTFVFATSLATGSAYAVTVSSQPSGALCSVSNGGGTIASANVSNVSVSCVAQPPANSGGVPDTSFGNGGKVTTDFSGAPPVVRVLHFMQEVMWS